MKIRLNNVLPGAALCMAAGCVQSVTEDAASAEPSALLAVSALPPAEGLTEPRLRLIDDRTARISVRLGEQEKKLRLVNPKEPSFRLALGGDERGIEFNDLGKGLDDRADDGQFSAEIPIDLEMLSKLNDEVANLEERTVFKFKPGTREVIGKFELPKIPFDLRRLREGEEVALPPLGEFGPFETLGGVSVSSINPQKSLIITSIPVIEDPARTANPCAPVAANNPLKVWTFGHLMEQMSIGSGLTPSAFTEQWLNSWLTTQVVNASGGAPILDATSDAAAANMKNLVINPWRARSGGGDLDLRVAPFRLQAIFYRPDLGQVSYGSPSNNAGELRFVFGLLEARDGNNDGDALDAGDTCQVTEMAVIFEYGVPLTACEDIKQFANKFVELSTFLVGSPAYGTALEALTESVVLHGAAPAKPNQNALNQLRTNEIDLTNVWQFREFVIAAGSGPLVQTTTKNNPRQHMVPFTSVPGVTPAPIDLNGSPQMIAELLSSPLPELSGGAPFLGGSVSYFPMSWDAASLTTSAELEARFNFSLNTCSSCHTQETGTFFYHVRPAGPGAVPTLSDFLQISPLTVVDVRGLSHTFAEKDNRKQALANFANASCGRRGSVPFEIFRAQVKSSG